MSNSVKAGRKQPKEFTVGDKLFKISDTSLRFSQEPATYKSFPVVVSKINGSSIYVKEDPEKNYVTRFPLKTKFPLTMKDMLGTTCFLTDDPSYADFLQKEVDKRLVAINTVQQAARNLYQLDTTDIEDIAQYINTVFAINKAK